MRYPCFVSIALALIGCSAAPPRLPERVAIPVAVACLDRIPDRPAFRSDRELLAQSDYAAVLALWLDRRLRQDYEAVIEAALQACVR